MRISGVVGMKLRATASRPWAISLPAAASLQVYTTRSETVANFVRLLRYDSYSAGCGDICNLLKIQCRVTSESHEIKHRVQ